MKKENIRVATITLFFFAISLLKYDYWASERSCQLLAWGYNGIKALLEEGLFAMVCNGRGWADGDYLNS